MICVDLQKYLVVYRLLLLLLIFTSKVANRENGDCRLQFIEETDFTLQKGRVIYPGSYDGCIWLNFNHFNFNAGAHNIHLMLMTISL